MTESNTHLLMKEIVGNTLDKMGFKIIYEPDYPPIKLISWKNYRPDIFGVKQIENKVQYAIVECETQPSKSKLTNKNWRKIARQTKIFEHSSLLYILAITSESLSKMISFRRFWEIWLINTVTKEVNKIPSYTK